MAYLKTERTEGGKDRWHILEFREGKMAFLGIKGGWDPWPILELREGGFYGLSWNGERAGSMAYRIMAKLEMQ